jgi:hypothetical protein
MEKVTRISVAAVGLAILLFSVWLFGQRPASDLCSLSAAEYCD